MKLHVMVSTRKFILMPFIAILALCTVLTRIPPVDGATAAWSKTYGGTAGDAGNYFVQTNDGGYAIAGTTASFGAGGRDAWLVKTDSAGNMQWNKTYGTTGDEYAYSVVQTIDGGYALFGMSFPGGALDALLRGLSDYWLVKTDSAGNMQWTKSYGAPATREYGFHAIQTSDGGYVMSGWNGTAGGGAQIASVWLVKADAAGNIQWNKTFARAPGRGNENGFTVIQAKDDGYAIAAFTNSSGALEGWLIKTDSNGSLQWDKTYGGAPYGLWYSLVQTADGGYATVGTTNSYGAGGRDVWLGKMDSAGNMQWNKTYGGAKDDYGTSIAQTVDGGYVIGGYTPSFGAGGNDVWVIRTDSNGNAQWNKTFGGPANDGGNGPHAIAQTTDGGYAVVNFGGSFGAGSQDAYLVKFDAAGNTPAPPAASAFTNVNVLAGWTWYFFAQGTGDLTPFKYQWYENTTLLQGQTSMVLPVTKTAAGNYTFTCKVTDAQGLTATSNTVTLTVMS